MRERRARVQRLGAQPRRVDEFLEEVAAPATVEGSIAALVIAESAEPDGQRYRYGMPEGSFARIVLSSKEKLVRPDPGLVFLPGEMDVETSLTVVHAGVSADPDARRSLESHFKIRSLDPVTEVGALIDAFAVSPGDSWNYIWRAIRKLDSETSVAMVGGRRNKIWVRGADETWQHPWAVLLPGSVVEEGEPGAIDVSYHRSDFALLSALGVVSEPSQGGLSDEEMTQQQWYAAFRTFWRRRFQDQSLQKTGKTPQWDYIEGIIPASAGPVAPYFGLQGSSRLRFASRLLRAGASDPSAVWCHATQGHVYERLHGDSPTQWFLRTEAELPTTLGPRPASRSVGRELECWSSLLPVVTEDCDFLGLPNVVAAVPKDLVDEAFHLALEATDANGVADFYAATASVGHKAPDVVRAIRAGEPANVPITDARVTSDARMSSLLDDALILVSSADRAAVLEQQWGLRTADGLTAMEFVAAGPPGLVADVYPGLSPSLLKEFGDVELIGCDSIWYEARGSNATRRSEVDHYLDGRRRFLFRIGTDSDVVLERLLRSLKPGVEEDELAAELQQSAKFHAGVREERIRAVADLNGKLGEMLSDDDLTELLPASLATAHGRSRKEDRARLAAMALAVHGTAILQKSRTALQAGGYRPPRVWAGSDAALRFVRQLGFPDAFAGRPSESRAPFVDVDGPLTLPPLHPFQESLAQRIGDSLKSREPLRGLLSLPTGAGKTRVATEAVVRAYAQDDVRGTVIWIADRYELCEQAVVSWREVWRSLGPERPLRVSRLWGDTNDRVEPAENPNHVVVATFQSLTKRIQQPEFAWLKQAFLIVIDEAHGSTTPSFTQILNAFGLDARRTSRAVIGLTATPFRGKRVDDGSETQRLVSRYGGRRFDADVFPGDDPYPELRRLGVLADAEFDSLEGVEFELDAQEMRTFEQFDTLPRSVEARIGLDPARNQRILARIRQLPRDWPKIVFTASVEQAELLAASLARDSSTRPGFDWGLTAALGDPVAAMTRGVRLARNGSYIAGRLRE